MSEKIDELYYEFKFKGLNEVDREIKKFDDSANKVTSSIKKFGAAVGIAFGTHQIISFMKSAIDSFAQSEVALKKLETALGRTSHELINYASALEATSAYADEAIVEAEAMIAMFTKDEEKIKALTKATMDFAAAQGMDLVSAAQLVAKTIGSDVNALGRYGIEVKGAANSSERFTDIVGGMNIVFGGQAAAQLDTYAGKIENLKNKIDNLKETIGEGLVNAIYGLNDAFEALNQNPLDWINQMTLNAQIAGIIKASTNASEYVRDAMNKAMNDVSSKGKTEIQKMIKDINNQLKALDKMPSMTTDDKNTLDQLKAKLQVYNNFLNRGLTDDEKKAAEEKLSTQEKFYNSVKFLSSKYFDWRVAQIEKEKNEFIKTGVDKVDAEKYAAEQLAKLNLQRYNYFEDLKAIPPGQIPTSKMKVPEMQAVPQQELETIKQDYETKLELETEYQKKLLEMREESEITYSEMMDATYQSMQNGFESTFRKMLQIESSSNNVLIQGFVTMANSFIAEVQRMIAQWISFQIIKGFLGAIFAPATGGASAVAAAATMHKGGTVVNSGGRVSVGPGFATGTDFIVPKGFPYDSYPIRVESGERVTVTPANRVAQSMEGLHSSAGFEKVVNAIQAMNMNLLKKKITVNISSKVDGLKFYEEKITPAQNRSNRSGKNVSGV